MVKELEPGDIIESHRCGKYELLEKSTPNRWKIKFVDTGYITERCTHSVRHGIVGDPYCPKIAGVGWLGTGQYKSRTSPPESAKTPQYRCWENMLYRVYDTGHRLANRYYGRNVEVCDEWLNFQTFAEWFDENYIEGYVLDKDITSPGSLLYSPETCSFVPQEINKFFTSMNKRRGDFPVGVYKSRNKFTARVTFRDETISEHFNTPEEAFSFYKEHKERLLKEMAQEYYDDGKINKEVYIHLMQWEAVPYPD